MNVVFQQCHTRCAAKPSEISGDASGEVSKFQIGFTHVMFYSRKHIRRRVKTKIKPIVSSKFVKFCWAEILGFSLAKRSGTLRVEVRASPPALQESTKLGVWHSSLDARPLNPEWNKSGRYLSGNGRIPASLSSWMISPSISAP